MKKLVNIGNDDQPMFIDPMEVTCVSWRQNPKELGIFNEKGRMLYINYESYGVDPQKMVERIAEGGNKLAYFPERDGEKLENPHYVAPSAVCFVTLAEKGHDMAIAGVAGFGYISNYKMTAEELESLVEGGKPFLKFTNDIAEARWCNSQGLYIDPKAITSIRDDGYHVNVHFSALESLDVKVNGDKPERHIFAMTLAGAHGGLKHIAGARNAMHIEMAGFSYISFSENTEKGREALYSLTMHRQPTENNPYPEKLRLIFNTAFARGEAFRDLTGQEPPKPTAPPAP